MHFSEELFDYCYILNRKYRSKYDGIDIYCDVHPNNDVEIRINWSSIGSQPRVEAKKFAHNLLAAKELADKMEAEIKSKFPGTRFV